jgi:dsRNA-specific ribonuclease
MTEKKIAIVKNEAIGKIALEMGLHKWLIISKHAEEKKIRTNLKKLGCLFESFIGALFLDFNKVVVKDSENWFQTMFVTGPGFQMAQKFIENVFDKHIDWTALIQNDDNYTNILQVKIQKEFKVTPHYLEIEHDPELGYKMGVYLCLGQSIHTVSYNNSIDVAIFKNYKAIHDFVTDNGRALIFMGMGQHKIKRKAEQIACNEALKIVGISQDEPC